MLLSTFSVIFRAQLLKGYFFQKGELQLHAYSNSNLAIDKDD